jgi:hypothetical protein
MMLNLVAPLSTIAVAGCKRDWVLGSTVQGGTCESDHDCASGVCVFRHCSRLCRDAVDCESAAPNCVAADREMPPDGEREFWYTVARPAEWGTPFPRVCLP